MEDSRMEYPDLWSRARAFFIDELILLPLMILSVCLIGKSREIVIPVFLIDSLGFCIYNIYFHSRCGQTPGKMFAGIKVVLVDGSQITRKEAFLRYSVYLFFAALTSIAWILAFLTISEDILQSIDWIDRTKMVRYALPQWWHSVCLGSILWGLGEVIFVLFNEKKRALHDLLAGTVVVRSLRETK